MDFFACRDVCTFIGVTTNLGNKHCMTKLMKIIGKYVMFANVMKLSEFETKNED